MLASIFMENFVYGFPSNAEFWFSYMKSNRKPQSPALSHKAVRTTAEVNCAPKECYLCSYEDIRHIGHADLQLRYPLLLDVVVWGRVYHWEADQEHVCVGVGQGSQLVVVLLQGENGRGYEVVENDGWRGHLPSGERLRALGLLSLEKGSWEGFLSFSFILVRWFKLLLNRDLFPKKY